MAIKKSKNNESITDFDNMMNEVEEELEVQQAEQNIADRVPELKQLSTDIDKATTAVINAPSVTRLTRLKSTSTKL